MSQKRKLTTRDLALIGVLAAMCAIATMIQIPFGAGAMVHLGSAAIFTVAILYGGVYAGFAGAIGSALFDLIGGHFLYTLWSFVIKGLAGFIAGSIAHGVWPVPVAQSRNWLLRALLGCFLAAAWTLGGYILAWWQVTGTMATALANAPSSLLTSGVGLIVAIFLSVSLRRRI